jgi:TetR/AcrR family transcriptional regulator, regulator of autoinduction and epiphytic fitness
MPVVKSHAKVSRRERARATRLRILTNARTLFIESGYPATTMEDIAVAAGVAVQTIYYTFRTKSSLLRGVVELAGAGELDAPPVERRAWMQDALREPSGDRALAIAIEHGVDIYVRTAPLWPAMLAASVTDPDVETYSRSVIASRRAGMRQLVRRLEDIGFLRLDLAADRGADIVFALLSHETYLALARDAGWSTEQIKAWLWCTLRMQLAVAWDPAPDALRGLSYEALGEPTCSFGPTDAREPPSLLNHGDAVR